MASAVGAAPPERSAADLASSSSQRGAAFSACAAAACAAAFAAARWRGMGLPRDSHRYEVLHVYRQILRAAEAWPSMKKKRVLAEIRTEFRINAGEQDAHKKEAMLADARRGLKGLLHDIAQNARLRATPSAPSWQRDRMRSSWWPDEGASGIGGGSQQQQQRNADQWALDELGVGASPTLSEAKAAFKTKAKACHPDGGGSSEDFKKLQHAWEHVERHLKQEMLRTQHGSRFRG